MAAGPSTLSLHHVTAWDPLAVCNDGSGGGYYFSQGSQAAGPSLWLIYLEGGLWCWSEETCVERNASTPFEMSSSGWPFTQSLEGIFDDDASLNPWAGANMVYIGTLASPLP